MNIFLKKLLLFFACFCFQINSQASFLETKDSKNCYEANVDIQSELLEKKESGNEDCNNQFWSPFKGGNVNVINGEFVEHYKDLSIDGPSDVGLNRFFCNFNFNSRYLVEDSLTGNWRINPESCAYVSFFKHQLRADMFKSKYEVIAFANKNGSTALFDDVRDFVSQAQIKNEYKSYLNVNKGYFSNSIYPNFAKNDQRCSKVSYKRLYKDGKYKLLIEKRNGDGGVLFFESEFDKWTSKIKSVSNINKDLKPCEFFKAYLTKEKLTNGNIVKYKYQYVNDFNNINRKTSNTLNKRIYSITLFNSTEEAELGSIVFAYSKDKITVTKNDGSYVEIYTKIEGNGQIVIKEIKHSDSRKSIYYDYQDNKVKNLNLLTSIRYQNGLILSLKYDDKGRVIEKGYNTNLETDNPHIFTSYKYNSRSTEEIDVDLNLKNIFNINKYGQIEEIQYFNSIDGSNRDFTLKENFSYSNYLIAGMLTEKQFTSNDEGLSYVVTYGYKKPNKMITCNNIDQKISYGNCELEVKRKFSKDGFGLVVEETIGGKSVTYTYQKDTDLITSIIIKNNQEIVDRKFYEYNSAACCVKKIFDNGSSEDKDNLEGVTGRKIQEIKYNETAINYCLPKEIIEKAWSNGKEVVLRTEKKIYTDKGKLAAVNFYNSRNQLCNFIAYEYNEYGEVIIERNMEGAVFEFFYDDFGRVKKVITPEKHIINKFYNKYSYLEKEELVSNTGIIKQKIYVYNNRAQLISKTDFSGLKTCFEYDHLGRNTAVIYPDGGRASFEYDCLGNTICERDQNGKSIERRYDVLGNLLSEINKGNEKIVFKYNRYNQKTFETTFDGSCIDYTRDGLGRETDIKIKHNNKIIDSEHRDYGYFGVERVFKNTVETKSCIYDCFGRVVVEINGTKRKEFIYDDFDQIIQLKENGVVTKIEYSPSGQLKSKIVQFEDGKVISYEKLNYDLENNIISKDENGDVTKFEYLGIDDGVITTDPFGYKTFKKIEYNQQGYLEIIIESNGIEKRTLFDFRGKQISLNVFDKLGNKIYESSDTLDLIGNVTSRILTVYDSNGNKTKEQKYRWSYIYDNLVSSFEEEENDQIRITKYTYNNSGKLEEILTPSGNKIGYTYDGLGRIATFISKDFSYKYDYDLNDNIVLVEDTITGQLTIRNYDINNNCTYEKLVNGYEINREFDSAGYIKKLNLPYSGSIEYVYENGFLQSITRNGSVTSYKRGMKGRIEQVSLPNNIGFIITKFGLSNRIEYYRTPLNTYYFDETSYDSMGNMLNYQEVRRDIDEDNIFNFEYDNFNQLIKEQNNTYRFDSNHNRLEKNGKIVSLGNFNQVSSFEDVKYVYDKDGNLEAKDDLTFEYDAIGRLIKVVNGEREFLYVYDSFNRRIQKIERYKNSIIKDVLFLFDGQKEIGCGYENEESLFELRILGDGCGAEIGATISIENDKGTFVTINDCFGNIKALIDVESEKIRSEIQYSVFGEFEIIGENLTNWLFQGKRLDEESGYFYFGRRFYDPKLGRWTSLDLIGFADGGNRYSYIKNTPLTHFDEYGLSSSTWSSDNFKLIYDSSDITSLEWNRRLSVAYIGLNKPAQLYSVDYDKHKGLDPFRGMLGIGFINGMDNKLEDAFASASYISSILGGPSFSVDLFYNPTIGLKTDLLECIENSSGCNTNKMNELLNKRWHEFFDKAPQDAVYMQIAHSQGVYQLKNALKEAPQEIRDRICVLAVAGPTLIPRSQVKDVVSIYSTKDPIRILSYLENKNNDEWASIQVIAPKNQKTWFDHEFQSETYREKIVHMVRDVKNGLKK